MKSVSIRKAKDNFAALVKAAQEGETTILTNRGKPRAKIAPMQEVNKVAPSQEAELEDKRPESPDLPTFEQWLVSLPHRIDF